MEIERFVEEAKTLLGMNLAAVVLYGSRFWGYATAESDWDVFVLINKREEGLDLVKEKLEKKYPKVSIMYLATPEEVLQKCSREGWASYIVLLKGSRVLYGTAAYEELLKKLSQVRPNKKLLAQEYKSEKNEFEMKALLEREGYEANKWAFLSIWKRLQILDFLANDRIEIEFEKNLADSENWLSGEEAALVLLLRERTFERNEEWGDGDRKRVAAILEKLNGVMEKETEK